MSTLVLLENFALDITEIKFKDGHLLIVASTSVVGEHIIPEGFNEYKIYDDDMTQVTHSQLKIKNEIKIHDGQVTLYLPIELTMVDTPSSGILPLLDVPIEVFSLPHIKTEPKIELWI